MSTRWTGAGCGVCGVCVTISLELLELMKGRSGVALTQFSSRNSSNRSCVGDGVCVLIAVPLGVC